jgi:hypothetical protein
MAGGDSLSEISEKRIFSPLASRVGFLFLGREISSAERAEKLGERDGQGQVSRTGLEEKSRRESI